MTGKTENVKEESKTKPVVTEERKFRVAAANRYREDNRERRGPVRSQVKVVVDDKPEVSKTHEATQDVTKQVVEKRESSQPVEKEVKTIFQNGECKGCAKEAAKECIAVCASKPIVADGKKKEADRKCTSGCNDNKSEKSKEYFDDKYVVKTIPDRKPEKSKEYLDDKKVVRTIPDRKVLVASPGYKTYEAARCIKPKNEGSRDRKQHVKSRIKVVFDDQHNVIEKVADDQKEGRKDAQQDGREDVQKEALDHQKKVSCFFCGLSN